MSTLAGPSGNLVGVSDPDQVLGLALNVWGQCDEGATMLALLSINLNSATTAGRSAQSVF